MDSDPIVHRVPKISTDWTSGFLPTVRLVSVEERGNKTTMHGGQITLFNTLNPEDRALPAAKPLSLWASLTALSMRPVSSLFTAYPERGKGLRA